LTLVKDLELLMVVQLVKKFHFSLTWQFITRSHKFQALGQHNAETVIVALCIFWVIHVSKIVIFTACSWEFYHADHSCGLSLHTSLVAGRKLWNAVIGISHSACYKRLLLLWVIVNTG